MAFPNVVPFLATFHNPQDWVSALITVLIATVLILFAAKFVLGRTSLIAALLTALLGGLLATFVAALVPGPSWTDLVIFIAVWALVAAIFFRTAWVRGAIIGLVAAVLLFLVNLIIDAVWV